jgi:acetyl-CoA synthetase
MGGVLVELLHDSALALAPVAVDEARSMIDSLRAARLLDGFRGARPIDRGVLAELVARVSTFAADHRDRVVELDLNPVICHPDGIVAVDALIRLVAAPIGAD